MQLIELVVCYTELREHHLSNPRPPPPLHTHTHTHTQTQTHRTSASLEGRTINLANNM